MTIREYEALYAPILAFYEEVKVQLKSLTRIQALLVAVCAMERNWQMFAEWTQLESAPFVVVEPKTFREPVRRVIDLFWEQVLSEKDYGDYEAERNALYEFVESSFDPNYGQDVDFGEGDLLLMLVQNEGRCFLETPEREEKIRRFTNSPNYTTLRPIANCITAYLELFVDRDCYDEEMSAEEIMKTSIWRTETAYILSDIAAARDFPANKQLFIKKRVLYTNFKR